MMVCLQSLRPAFWLSCGNTCGIVCWIVSVKPDSVRPYGLPPAGLLCHWGFSRQEPCSGLPCPPPGDLPNPGSKPTTLTSPALARAFFTTSATSEAPNPVTHCPVNNFIMNVLFTQNKISLGRFSGKIINTKKWKERESFPLCPVHINSSKYTHRVGGPLTQSNEGVHSMSINEILLQKSFSVEGSWRVGSHSLRRPRGQGRETSEMLWERAHRRPSGVSLVAQMVKRLSAVQETRVRSLGWEDPLQKEMAVHSSILAWKIPWTEEPGGLQSMGLPTVRYDWATSLFTFKAILKIFPSLGTKPSHL